MAFETNRTHLVSKRTSSSRKSDASPVMSSLTSARRTPYCNDGRWTLSGEMRLLYPEFRKALKRIGGKERRKIDYKRFTVDQFNFVKCYFGDLAFPINRVLIHWWYSQLKNYPALKMGVFPGMTLNSVGWWGSGSGTCGSMENPFIAIIRRSTPLGMVEPVRVPTMGQIDACRLFVF